MDVTSVLSDGSDGAMTVVGNIDGVGVEPRVDIDIVMLVVASSVGVEAEIGPVVAKKVNKMKLDKKSKLDR